MTDPARIEARIAAMRAFNRFYTRHVGALDEGHLESRFSLAEVRVLYELSVRQGATASDLIASLQLDPAYLSRLLKGLRAQCLVQSSPAPQDRRQRDLRLTAQGEATYATLEQATHKSLAAVLETLPEARQERLLQAMRIMRDTLEPERGAPPAVVVRPQRPGDLGWILRHQASFYWRANGWGGDLEAALAQCIAGFLARADAAGEQCWIAESGGEAVGSVFLLRDSDEQAQLSYLFILPEARGRGIGRLLLETGLAFAHGAGYRRLVVICEVRQSAVQGLLRSAGFQLREQAGEARFGLRLTRQTWERAL
ncbi:MAG: helix-turn-helix domain-containing GNAT family N-acetyltransferase [Rhodospirillales bacterium]